MPFSLEAIFGVDTTGARAAFKSLRRDLNDLVGEYGKLGAGVAVGAFVALAKGAIDLGSHLADTSANIGINVESLQALEAQHKRNGVSSEQLTKALEKVKATVIAAAQGDEKATEALTQLHLKASALINLPLDKQYEAIAKAAAKAKNSNEAYSAVTAILGEKVGPKLMSSLRELAEQGLPAVIDSATKAGHVMSADTIAALDKAGDAIDDFKKQATIAVGNIIVDFRTEDGLKLLGLKLLKLAGDFGGMVMDALGEANSFVGAAFKGTFNGVINYLRDGFLDVVQGIARAMNALLPSKFEINIGNLEQFKSSGKGISDEITEAIAKTSPATFRKDIGAFWDKAIKDQQGVVDNLNKVEFKDAAANLRSGGQDAGANITGGARAASDILSKISIADFKNLLEGATGAEKIVLLQERQNALVKEANELGKESIAGQKLMIAAKEVEAEKTKAINDERKKGALGNQELLELYEFQRKALTGLSGEELARAQAAQAYIASQKAGLANLNDEEKTRYLIILNQAAAKVAQKEAEELLEKGLEKLTPKEKERLAVLADQLKNLTAQRKVLEGAPTPADYKAAADYVKGVVGKSTAENADIVNKAAQEAANILHDATAGVPEEMRSAAEFAAETWGDSATRLWNIAVDAADQIDRKLMDFENFYISITRTGASYESQSTASLQGVLGRLTQQLTTVDASGRQIKDADINSDYGGYVTASVIRGEIAAIQRELTLRTQVQSYANQYGQDAARSQFGDTVASRGLQNISDSSTATSAAVQRIANGLAENGWIPHK